MRPRRAVATERARLVVLAVLLSNLGWVVALPLALTRPPSPVAYAGLVLLLALLVAAYVLTLRAAVTPWVETRTRTRLLAGVLGLTAALAPLCLAWAEPGEEPWAWLAGFAAGVAPLVLRWRAAAVVAAATVAAAVLGALASGASVPQHLLFTLGTAAVVVAVAQVAVWLLRLLVAAEAGRAAEAGLAVTQERLRLAREVHDVLGHRLTVIALQAEVAGAEEIRELATTTLREVRAAVHDQGTLDLAEQLTTARLVLRSAGIEAMVDVDPDDLDLAAAQLVAAVVREAVTNVLRHSDARQVSITLAGGTVVIGNDGLRAAAQPAGMGLTGLGERAARAGSRLRAGREGDRFVVRLELAAS